MKGDKAAVVSKLDPREDGIGDKSPKKTVKDLRSRGGGGRSDPRERSRISKERATALLL